MQHLCWYFRSAQAAISECGEGEKAPEVTAEEAAKAELDAKVEAAKAALKDAAEKFSAAAADKADDLKGFATVAFKSLKAGLEEAKKTFDQEKK